MREPLIDFIYVDAGGGHRASATAVHDVIGGQDRGWRVRLINLGEVLAPLDLFLRFSGVDMAGLYNMVLRKGWTLGSRQILRPMQGLIRMVRRPSMRILEKFWRQDPPSMVVSFVPHFNKTLNGALHAVRPGAPFVTVLTDLADYPPWFWMERQEQYLICGSARAVEQALQMGHAPERVFRVSGMILRPHFYGLPPVDRGEERLRLGLEPDLPTGLVLFGGYGGEVMLDIGRRLQYTRRPLQLIFLCGHNLRLAKRLRNMCGPMPLHVEGFTQEVPSFMQLADFMIGKPGPGSISEAIAMRLPVIVERNAWTLPQERYNADWLLENGVGMVLKNFRAIAPAVEELIEGDRLARYKERTAAMDNRAVFEIPDILGRLLA